MTPAEGVLWLRLRRNGIGQHFQRQQVIDGFIADFYCHSAGVVVEVAEASMTSDENTMSDATRFCALTGCSFFASRTSKCYAISMVCLRASGEPVDAAQKSRLTAHLMPRGLRTR